MSSLVDCAAISEGDSLTICLPEMSEATDAMFAKDAAELAAAIASTDGSGSIPSTEYIEVGESTTKRFNFLVAGANGSGKSTFCLSSLNRYFPSFEMQPVQGPTLHIEERGRCEKIQGRNTRIIVTIVDTPGYGDRMNNNDRVSPVIEYIEQQNRTYEEQEEYRRPNNQENDTRIHCCFYFIMPHRLTPLDIEFMTRLQTKAPIVPIIAKRDTINDVELEQQLRLIHSSLQEHSIRVFDFMERDIDESWLTTKVSKKLMTECQAPPETPFSRIGMSLHEAGDTISSVPRALRPPRRQIRNVFAVISGRREYSWGTADENDILHSDTPRLHTVLFTDTTLQSLGRLREHTNTIHDVWRRHEKQRRKAVRETTAQRLAQEKRLIEAQKAQERTKQYMFLWKLVICTVLLPGVWWATFLAKDELGNIRFSSLVQMMVFAAGLLLVWRTF